MDWTLPRSRDSDPLHALDLAMSIGGIFYFDNSEELGDGNNSHADMIKWILNFSGCEYAHDETTARNTWNGLLRGGCDDLNADEKIEIASLLIELGCEVNYSSRFCGYGIINKDYHRPIDDAVLGYKEGYYPLKFVQFFVDAGNATIFFPKTSTVCFVKKLGCLFST